MKLLSHIDNNAFPKVRPVPRKLRFRGGPLFFMLGGSTREGYAASVGAAKPPTAAR